MRIRINKYLANVGVAARRKIDELILAGKVTINGKLAKLGDQVDPATDRVYIDGKPTTTKETTHEYIVLNKPLYVLSSASDNRYRKTVLDIVKSKNRLFPVGRLDYNSTGLIILTNDGELALRMTHPRYHVPKTYIVETNQKFTDSQLNRLRNGVYIEGKKTLKCEVNVVDERKFEITLHQGMKRQIRYMCKQVGLVVRSLNRVCIGNIALGNLKKGEYRHLSSEELRGLKQYLQLI